MSDAGLTIESVDLAGMQRLAESMQRVLTGPLVFGLTGTLGSGKTALVQCLARAAGVDAADVTSPTFTLLQTYHGQPRLHHLDAYRVADEDEFLEIGVDELFEDDKAWTLVEWADRVTGVMPQNTLWVALTVEDESHRTVSFRCHDSAIHEQLKTVISMVD